MEKNLTVLCKHQVGYQNSIISLTPIKEYKQKYNP